MEEKILIKSEVSQTTKRVFMAITISLIVVAMIFLFVAISQAKDTWQSHQSDYYYEYYYRCKICGSLEIYEKMPSHIIETHSDRFSFSSWAFGGNALVFMILNFSFIFIAGCFALCYFLLKRCNITVTEKNVYGTTFWGKKVVLPIHMVSAYATSKFLATIAITTMSGYIKFRCVGNYEEIATVLSGQINNKQEKTEMQQNDDKKQEKSDNLDSLIKLKGLLDSGIISQEEFDAKKKEILGI